ncbi:neutral zinc metallopeptidase [Pseudonocardia sp. NPDC049154]|uniref:neutral zinc metallopeptidase n=1 Tax=Pseudonocardia sp. NPDC049154 TaxID=3155501 RepID=UPI0033D7E145
MSMRITQIMGRITGVLAAGAVLALGLTGTATAQPAQAPACPTLEGCYGYQDMRAFSNELIALVDGFSGASYTNMSRPVYRYIPAGTQQPTACTDTTGAPAVADGTAFNYCPADGTVYIGQDSLYELYSLSGDGAAALGLAHEWGHHVQDVAGVSATVVSQLGAIQSENQADCIAGAFLGHLDARGILEPDDYADVRTVLPKIAAGEDDLTRDHGTVEERATAVDLGLRQGLGGCNVYFPETPVLA